MIDIKAELGEYKKIKIDEIEASGQELTDDIKNSILLYNKAVDSLANGSEDIAVIELKKAVSVNPNFYEALNLLGICYSYKNDTVKAAEIFDRVVKGESNGVKAKKYLEMVKAPEQSNARTKTARVPRAARTARTAKKGPAADNTPLNTPKMVTGLKGAISDKRFYILSCAACFAAGAILIGVISLAAHSLEAKDTGADLSAKDSTVQTQQQTDKYKAKYDELTNKYNTLQKDLESANKKVEYYQTAGKLYNIQSLVAGKQYENAADALISLKAVEFTGDEKNMYNNLVGSVMPEAAHAVYVEGIELFNSRKYEESIKKLDKVLQYQPTFNKGAEVLYFEGKSYQQLNDSKNAVAVFQKLINTYPGSVYAKYAKGKIARLTDLH